MRKTAIALGLLATMAATAAEAQHRRHHHHAPRHHHKHNNNWVAPLVGGLLIGGAIYGLSQQPSYAQPQYQYQPQCRRVYLGDQWNGYQFVSVYRTECY